MKTETTAPFIPDTAPFNADQRAWLNGFLAGMFSHGSFEDTNSVVTSTPITILFGSQTGTAETLAKKASKALKNSFQIELLEMSAATPEMIAENANVILITSTYGEGEPPDNARSLHASLMKEAAPKLVGVNYAILGLGDSAYPDFCKCSKEFDTRLEELGAVRKIPTIECDGDPEEKYAQWLKDVSLAFGKSSDGELNLLEDGIEPCEDRTYARKNPYKAKIVNSLNLNKAGSAKATHHVEISLEGSGIDYKPGDALGVWPRNDPRLVDEIIISSGFEADEPTQLPDKSEGSLFDALRDHYDISVLTEAFLLACARLTKDKRLKEIVTSKEKLNQYLLGRGLVDPIVEFGVKFPTTEYLIASLKQLQPRLYSISSSQRAHPNEVHLTVGKVVYDMHGRQRFGVCSNFLANAVKQGEVRVYLHPNKNFRLPDDPLVPVIMIGPGTGIAPFRAFLEEREALGAGGRNWLFFGDQHADSDFLYEEEIKRFLDNAILSRMSAAFSRDQTEKIYVQHKLIEEGEAFYQWIKEGAHIYICGDASRMAKDVENAIVRVLVVHGSLTDEEACLYLEEMKQSKRFQRDVY